MGGSKGRSVVQGFRRGTAATAANPFPTVRSGAEAIEAAHAPEWRLAPPATIEPPFGAEVQTRVGAHPRLTVSPDRMWPGASPGAIFDSADEAARAFLKAVNLFSKAENVEYLSNIYQARDGKYGFTDALRTTKTGTPKTTVLTPGRYVGTVHTHANYMDQFDGRLGAPRTDAYRSDEFSQGDIEFMRGKKELEAGYLGTPSGAFYKWTRPTGPRPF